MMVRSMAVAGILGALAAASVAYAFSQPMWRNVITTWLGGTQRTGGVMVTTEDWPICTTMASLDSVEGLDPDFAAGKKALAAANWNEYPPRKGGVMQANGIRTRVEEGGLIVAPARPRMVGNPV
jgi:hypothetical protein